MNTPLRRYRYWYAKLLRLHSRPYRERFGEGMEQTFADLLHERAAAGKSVFGCAVWMFTETSVGILRERVHSLAARNRNVLRIALVTMGVLLVPLLAMQFTDQVDWNAADFVAAGTLLFGTGLAYDLATRRAGTTTYRAAMSMALSATLLLVWINLAVGIIGSEDNPANMLYGAVLAVGIVGAAVTRLRPHGMARTLFGMALAQAVVPAIAFVLGGPDLNADGAVSSLLGILTLNAIFVALFVGSAMLFRRAGAKHST